MSDARLNLRGEVVEDLRRIAATEGVSVPEALALALRVYHSFASGSPEVVPTGRRSQDVELMDGAGEWLGSMRLALRVCPTCGGTMTSWSTAGSCAGCGRHVEQGTEGPVSAPQALAALGALRRGQLRPS